MLFENEFDDIEEEILAMAADDGTDDRPDKVQQGKLLNTMRLVSLSDDREREYEGFFYPGKTKFREAFDSASVTMAQLGTFMFVLRRMWRRANEFSSLSPEVLNSRVNTEFVEGFAYTENLINSASKYFWNKGNGVSNAHVVASSRYPEGFDIVYTAESAECALGGNITTIDADRFAAEDTSSVKSDNERFNTWLTPFGTNMAKAVEQIYEYLYENKAPNVMTKRRTVPLGFDFARVQDIFEKATGVTLDKQYIENIFFSFEDKLTAQFMQLDILSFPSDSVRHISASLADANSSTNDRIAKANALMQDRLNHNAVYLNVQPVAYFRLTIEEDICRYIAQAQDNTKISLTLIQNWFKMWRSQYWKSGGGEQQIAAGMIPRYMLAPSALASLPARRKANGYVSENTRADDDGLYITPDGTFRCRPTAEQYGSSNIAKDFEALSEKYLLFTDKFIDIPESLITPQDKEAQKDIVKELRSYQGVNIAHDWDSGTDIIAGGNANTDARYAMYRADRRIGSVKPDTLAIADFAGFDFAREGEQPIKRTFANAMYNLTNYLTDSSKIEEYSGALYGNRNDVTAMTRSPNSAIRRIIRLYIQMAYIDEKAPKIETLIQDAVAKIGLSSEEDAVLNRLEDYVDFITSKGEITARYKFDTSLLITNLLDAGLVAISSSTSGALYRAVRKELSDDGANVVGVNQVLEELQNDDRFFAPHISTPAEFKRVYNTFGGFVFFRIVEELLKFPVSYFMNQIAETKELKGATENSSYPVQLLPNTEIMNNIYPAMLMLGKYIPNSDKLFAEAKAITDSLEPDPDFSGDDIKVPGLEDERYLYPHQIATQAHLRRPVPPAFAILALEPGGGKTGQGAIDVATLMGDILEQQGERVIPMIIAPNGLLSTWCADIKYFFGDKFNVFPINSDTKQRWTQEELLEKIRTAPINTIYIVSMQFLQSNSVRISIGERNIQVSANVELVKQIGANYIAIDESHNLKSFSSARHRYIKQITTSPTVKWLRLLTGTLMPDRAKDIEAQVALYSPHIFRAGEIANVAAGAAVNVNGDVIESSNQLNGERAITKLSRYCAFVVKKRKEWAFMLPIPLEKMYEVDMVDPSAPEEDQADMRLHEEMYNYLLDKTLEDLKDEMSAQAAAERAAKKRGGDEDEDGDDKIVEDEDFAELASLDGAGWEAHVANFIRMCTAPQSLPEEFKAVFGEERTRPFIPNKVRFIIKLIQAHFNPPKWDRDGFVQYYGDSKRKLIEYDLVQHEGKYYVVRKFSEGVQRANLPESEYTKTPDKNPDYWKEEPFGKLIVVTRYDSTGNAIYDTLPPDLKAKAVVFNGSVEDPKAAFQRFRTSDKVQILIANEQRITEGYNLQLASRIIRVELPWGPGAIAQTQARILRPDPKARQEGRMTRDVIYLDHVTTKNTVESAQYARIIMKTFGTYKLTESNNPLFKDVLAWETPDPSDVPELKLGARMLKNRLGLSDDPYAEMVSAMAQLNSVQNWEFLEMKRTQNSDMAKIESAPAVKGSAKEKYLPFVENQPIADPKKWEPLPVEQYVESKKITDFKDLIGLPAITEFGTGMIVDFFTRRGDKNRLSGNGIKVRLKDPMPGRDEFLRTKPTLVMIPDIAKISTTDLEEVFKVDLHSTATAQKRAGREQERIEQQRREQEEIEEREAEIKRKQEEKQARVVRKTVKDGEKRRENVKSGRPANEGIFTIDDVAKVKLLDGKTKAVEAKPKAEEIPPVELELYPSYYHGFETLEAISDEEIDLKKFGFVNMGPYAFIEVSNKHRYRTIAQWIHSTFDVSDKTVDRLVEIDKAFEPGNVNTHKLWYKLELAPIRTLPAFFQLRKKMVENRNEVRVYPVFTKNHLMLCVDLRTNPAIVKYLGKSVPGAAAKWQRSDGHWFYFGKNKADLKAKINEVAGALTVTNKREALKELAELRMHQTK